MHHNTTSETQVFLKQPLYCTGVQERELSWVPLGRRSLYGPCLDSHWRDQLLEHAGARERQQAYSCADLCEL
jgi:hypothetical protein